MGRYDADFGTILLNRGNDNFSAQNINGVTVKGQVRFIKPIKIAGQTQAFVLARNNDSAMIIGLKNRSK